MEKFKSGQLIFFWKKEYFKNATTKYGQWSTLSPMADITEQNFFFNLLIFGFEKKQVIDQLIIYENNYLWEYRLVILIL